MQELERLLSVAAITRAKRGENPDAYKTLLVLKKDGRNYMCGHKNDINSQTE